MDQESMKPELSDLEPTESGEVIKTEKKLLTVLSQIDHAHKTQDIPKALDALLNIIDESPVLYPLPDHLGSDKENALTLIQKLATVNDRGQYQEGEPIKFYSEDWKNQPSYCDLLDKVSVTPLLHYMVRECGIFELGERYNISEIIKFWLWENQGYQTNSDATLDNYYNSEKSRDWTKDHLWAYDQEKKRFSPDLKFSFQKADYDPLHYDLLQRLIDMRGTNEKQPLLKLYAEQNPYFDPVSGKVEGKWTGSREPIFRAVTPEKPFIKNKNYRFIQIKNDVVAIKFDQKSKKEIDQKIHDDLWYNKYQFDKYPERIEQQFIEMSDEEDLILAKTPIPKTVNRFHNAELSQGYLPELSNWFEDEHGDTLLNPVRILSKKSQQLEFELSRNQQEKMLSLDAERYETQDDFAEVILQECAQRSDNLEELSSMILVHHDIFWQSVSVNDYKLLINPEFVFHFRDKEYQIQKASGYYNDDQTNFYIEIKDVVSGQMEKFSNQRYF